MGLLSDFFIADESSATSYDGSAKFPAADRCQLRNVSPLQGGQMLAVLRGEEYVAGMVTEFQLITPQDAESWIMSVPQDMVAKLAALPGEEIPNLAAKFADATQRELAWSADDFLPIVTELKALARSATATGRSMYLWNSL